MSLPITREIANGRWDSNKLYIKFQAGFYLRARIMNAKAQLPSIIYLSTSQPYSCSLS